MTKETIYLALPNYGSFVAQALPGLLCCSAEHTVHIGIEGGSLLPFIFNRLWCDALNLRAREGITLFAMHHSDIELPGGWLDVLVAELAQRDLDILSVVSPIKDARGLTSTAWQKDDGKIRRLTMHEVMNLPETFTQADTHNPGWPLLANTACWVCKFRAPWVDTHPGFTFVDGILQEDGEWRAKCISEDWLFSAEAAKRGARIGITRKVKLIHHGTMRFPNDEAWGTEEEDPGDLPQRTLRLDGLPSS